MPRYLSLLAEQKRLTRVGEQGRVTEDVIEYLFIFMLSLW
jgi:hypothetical protein